MSNSERYQRQQKLGSGTYGRVFRALDTVTGSPVALKLVRPDHEEAGIPVDSFHEISILKHMKHPCIVEMKEIVRTGTHLELILEFLDRSLRSHLDAIRGRLPPVLVQSYTYQLLTAVDYIHSVGIIHSDLRPENLLLNRNGLLKIGNFQKARIYHYVPSEHISDHRMVCYQAPEILIGTSSFDEKADIWSCGCIIAELATLRKVFNGDSRVDQIMQICGVLGTPTTETWPEFVDLVQREQWPLPDGPDVLGLQFDGAEVDSNLVDLLHRLLLMNPADRITTKEALQHAYFASIPDEWRGVYAPG
jgi:serine/threonine protein kinase